MRQFGDRANSQGIGHRNALLRPNHDLGPKVIEEPPVIQGADPSDHRPAIRARCPLDDGLPPQGVLPGASIGGLRSGERDGQAQPAPGDFADYRSPRSRGGRQPQHARLGKDPKWIRPLDQERESLQRLPQREVHSSLEQGIRGQFVRSTSEHELPAQSKQAASHQAAQQALPPLRVHEGPPGSRSPAEEHQDHSGNHETEDARKNSDNCDSHLT